MNHRTHYNWLNSEHVPVGIFLLACIAAIVLGAVGMFAVVLTRDNTLLTDRIKGLEEQNITDAADIQRLKADASQFRGDARTLFTAAGNSQRFQDRMDKSTDLWNKHWKEVFLPQWQEEVEAARAWRDAHQSDK